MSNADRRRNEILELLYIYEKCSVDDLVQRFGVSRRTISSDIVYLTNNHNVISKSGPHGGIMVEKRKNDRGSPYLMDFEIEWLKEKYDKANSEEDRIVAHSILRRFSL